MKISDMSLCEEYRYVCGVSCDCDSHNVKLLGTYTREGKGFFVDIKCLACQKTTQDGDGDFDDYFLITDGRIDRREELIDMSEAISKKCAIARTINGISLNGYEFILEEDNETIKAFADKGVAVSYLKGLGVTSEDIYYLRFLDYDKLTANNEYEDVFGEIKFSINNEQGASGTYEGKPFNVVAEEEDEQGNSTYGIVEGDFTDEERLYIFTQWTQQEVDTEIKIGDVVDDETVENYINVLPPATHNGLLIQMGEPYSHVGDRATYPTLAKVDGQWTYAGHCYRGESTEPNVIDYCPEDSEWMRIHNIDQ